MRVVAPPHQPDRDGLRVTHRLAAACRASYILLNRTVGRRVPGAQGAAAAATVSAVLFLPVGVVLALRHPPTVQSVGFAVAAGVPLSVLVPRR